MTGSLIEWAIIAFIVCSIGYVVRRNGAANPVGTGEVSKTIDQVEGRLSKVEGRLDAKRDKMDQLSAQVGVVSGQVAELQQESARRNEVVSSMSESIRTLASNFKTHETEVMRRMSSIEGLARDVAANRDVIERLIERERDRDQAIDRMIAEVAGLKSDVGGVNRNVDRIYNVLVEKGMGR